MSKLTPKPPVKESIFECAPMMYYGADCVPAYFSDSGVAEICSCCGAGAVRDAELMNIYNRGVMVGIDIDLDKLIKGRFEYKHFELEGGHRITLKISSLNDNEVK
jgi:hypothetical protein